MIYQFIFISLTQIPRFFVELILYGYCGILFIIKTGENLDNLLPMVAVMPTGLKLCQYHKFI